VYVEGPINPETGFVRDYGDISDEIKPLINFYLDHCHLNTTLSIYPSSENILMWLGGKIDKWSKLALEETCTSYAELTRGEYDNTAR
jgi:6-pyruvoyltetrahydropterin/6-carboxytetrahydropterin synthase